MGATERFLYFAMGHSVLSINLQRCTVHVYYSILPFGTFHVKVSLPLTGRKKADKIGIEKVLLFFRLVPLLTGAARFPAAPAKGLSSCGGPSGPSPGRPIRGEGSPPAVPGLLGGEVDPAAAWGILCLRPVICVCVPGRFRQNCRLISWKGMIVRDQNCTFDSLCRLCQPGP